MNVNTLGNLQQNIVSTDLIKRLEQMAWLWNNMEPINDQFPCVYEAITALREIEGLKEKLKTALIWDDIESERNEKLQARIEELEKCMETPRIEDLETIEQLEQALICIAKVEKVNSTSGLAEVRALGRFARTERERIRKL